jgi:hypothetical protein
MEKEFLFKGVSESKVQLEEIQETPKNVSAPTDPIQEVQDVVPQDVEAPAQHPLIPYRRYKMLYHKMLKHQPHVGL